MPGLDRVDETFSQLDAASTWNNLIETARQCGCAAVLIQQRHDLTLDTSVVRKGVLFLRERGIPNQCVYHQPHGSPGYHFRGFFVETNEVAEALMAHLAPHGHQADRIELVRRD